MIVGTKFQFKLKFSSFGPNLPKKDISGLKEQN